MLSPLRRQTAFASAALVLAAALSSCGFDPATDRENQIAPGATEQDGTMDVLSATVVAAESGEAVLIAGLANNSRTDADALVQVVIEAEAVESQEGEEAEQAAQEEPGAVTVGEFEPVEVAPQGFVSLSQEGGTDGTTTSGPIPLEGELEPGSVLTATMVFESGERVSVDPPVVVNCGQYAEVPGLPAGDESCETAEEEAH